MEINIEKLPYYIKGINELSDRLYQKVTEHLQSSISYVSREEYVEMALTDTIDLQGELSVAVFELRRISWLLVQLKRSMDGSKLSVSSMNKKLDEYRQEINNLAESIRVNMFVLRDRINYLRNKVDV